MARMTIQEAVKFLVKHTTMINTESAKWKFSVIDIDKQIAVTRINSIEYHMLNIMRNNAKENDATNTIQES
jgi:hypothetical protein